MAWDVFYVVVNDQRGYIKFGITVRDGRARLSYHRGAGYRTTLRLMTDLPSDTAEAIERAVLATLRLASIAPVRGREYYDVAALALVLDVADNYPIPKVA
jgi:hypothetical protein